MTWDSGYEGFLSQFSQRRKLSSRNAILATLAWAQSWRTWSEANKNRRSRGVICPRRKNFKNSDLSKRRQLQAKNFMSVEGYRAGIMVYMFDSLAQTMQSFLLARLLKACTCGGQVAPPLPNPYPKQPSNHFWRTSAEAVEHAKEQ